MEKIYKEKEMEKILNNLIEQFYIDNPAYQWIVVDNIAHNLLTGQALVLEDIIKINDFKIPKELTEMKEIIQHLVKTNQISYNTKHKLVTIKNSKK